MRRSLPPDLATQQREARKTVEQMLNPLIHGGATEAFIDEARKVLMDHGQCLTPKDQVRLLSKALSKNATLADKMTRCPAMEVAPSPEDWFAALRVMCAPDRFAFDQFLMHYTQEHNQTTVAYLEKVAAKAKSLNLRVPNDPTQISVLIHNMREDTGLEVMNIMNSVQATRDTPVTFTDLEIWAGRADQKVAQLKAKQKAKANKGNEPSGDRSRSGKPHSSATHTHDTRYQRRQRDDSRAPSPAHSNRSHRSNRDRSVDARSEGGASQGEFERKHTPRSYLTQVSLAPARVTSPIPQDSTADGFVTPRFYERKYAAQARGLHRRSPFRRTPSPRTSSSSFSSPSASPPREFHRHILRVPPVVVSSSPTSPAATPSLLGGGPLGTPPGVSTISANGVAFADKPSPSLTKAESPGVEEMSLSFIFDETPAAQPSVSASKYHTQKRMPRNAEQADLEPSPSQRNRYMPNTFTSSGESRLAAAMFNVSLLHLIRMWDNPAMPNFIMAAKQLMKASEKDEAEGVTRLLKVVTAMAAGFAKQGTATQAKEPAGEVKALANTEVKVQLGTEEEHAQDPDMQCATVMSPQVAIPPAMRERHPSCLTAAISHTDRRVQLGATMPYLKMHFVRKGRQPDTSQTRRGHLDTGANLSFISGRALKRDRHLWGPDVKIHNLEGSPVTLADGHSHGRIEALVEGLPVCIGDAIYEIDCVVMEPAGVDYLLGFGFFNTWQVVLKPHRGTAVMGVERKGSLLPSHKYRRFQEVPIKYDFKEYTFPLLSNDGS